MTEAPSFITRDMLAFSGSASFSLSLDIITGFTQAFELRGYTKEGAFTYRFNPAGTNQVETFSFAVPDVPIAVSVAASNEEDYSASAHCTLYLAVNDNRIVILEQGTITGIFGIAWPHKLSESNTQLFGYVSALVAADPGAGQNLTITIPNNINFEVIAFQMKFIASATVADRTINVDFNLPNFVQARRVGAATIQANEDQTLNFIPGGTTAVITANSVQEIAIPLGLLLHGGSSITTSITNLQAGDEIYDHRLVGRVTYDTSSV